MTEPATPINHRTQAERRADTIGRLVSATIEAITEVGYHRTSLGEVERRAKTSRGGLFAHFDSRLDLVVAAAEEAGRRLLEEFRVQVASAQSLDVTAGVELVRHVVRDDVNAVWFELLVAARTDTELRTRLRPVADALHEEIRKFTEPLAEAVGIPGETAHVLTTSLLHMLDGEAIFRVTLPRPELEQARLELLAGLVERVAGRANLSEPRTTALRGRLTERPPADVADQ